MNPITLQPSRSLTTTPTAMPRFGNAHPVRFHRHQLLTERDALTPPQPPEPEIVQLLNATSAEEQALKLLTTIARQQHPMRVTSIQTPRQQQYYLLTDTPPHQAYSQHVWIDMNLPRQPRDHEEMEARAQYIADRLEEQGCLNNQTPPVDIHYATLNGYTPPLLLHDEEDFSHNPFASVFLIDPERAISTLLQGAAHHEPPQAAEGEASSAPSETSHISHHEPR